MLQQQISLRNNSLGKQLTPSSRLAYEGDLLRAIDSCIDYLRGQEQQELRGTLEQLTQDKRAQLAGVFWNALNASPEVERYLRFSNQALPTNATEDAAALDALTQLATIGSALPAVLPPSATQLDPVFFALHASDQGGQLITSLASLTHSLNPRARPLSAGALCRTSSSSITPAACSPTWRRWTNAGKPGVRACANSARWRRYRPPRATICSA